MRTPGRESRVTAQRRARPVSGVGEGSTSRHVAVSVVGNAFAPLAALATAPIMAHGLGVAGRGDVAAATAPLLLAVSLGSFGIPSAVTYLLAKNTASRNLLASRALLLVLLGGAGVAGLVVALAGLLSGGEPPLRRLVLLASCAILPTLFGAILQAVAAGEHRWRLVATERFVTAASRLAALAALTVCGRLDATSAVVVLAAAPVAGALVYLPMILRPPGALRRAGHSLGPATVANDLISYGLRVWVGSIAGVLLLRLDQALIGPLSGTDVLGVYVVAATIADLPLVVNSAVRDVLFAAGSAEQRGDALARAARVSTLLVGVVVMGVAIVLPWGLPMLFGDAFASAVPACWVLLGGLVVSNPGSVAGVALSSRGRPGLRSLALGAACVVNIALVFVLTPIFGAVGAAAATAAGSIAAGWLNLVLLCRISTHRLRDFTGARVADLASIRSVARTMIGRA